jgi:chemotaxis signal transduction protein
MASGKRSNAAKNGGQNGSHPVVDDTRVQLDTLMAEIESRLVVTGSLPSQEQPAGSLRVVERQQALVFRLLDLSYAVGLDQVAEIVRDPDITRVPGLPGWVKGVTSHHGDIISVVDLAAFLKLPSHQTGSEQMVVLMAEKLRIGLLVDDISVIHTFSAEDIISPPFKTSPEMVNYLRGAIERPEGFIRLLDASQLLLGSEMQQFS